MRVKDIAGILQEFAPESLQENWDNSGFMVGDYNTNVTKVLLALDCTEDVVDEAKEIGAEMIVTHHPLLFKGLKKIGSDTYVERVVKNLIKNDISLYSIHTNIDKVLQGVSGIMADKLCLINQTILNKEGEQESGLGVIGELEQPMDAISLVALLKEVFDVQCVKSSNLVQGKIKKVAVCGGSGSSLIGQAMASGAQVLVTGDVSYHNFFCEKDFMVMDIGHYESEIGVVDLIREILLKKIPNFAVYKSCKNNNPIQYHL